MPEYLNTKTRYDLVNLDHQDLRHVHDCFERCARNKSGQLDLPAFKKAFQTVFPPWVRSIDADATSTILDHLFQQVDDDADGLLTWPEFSTFILNRSIGGDRFREGLRDHVLQDPLPEDPYNTPASHHRDMIHSIISLPRISKYITCGRDGTLRVWGARTRRHLRTVDVSTTTPPAWVTACADLLLSLPGEGPAAAAGVLAVCCTDRSLRLYDAAQFKPLARHPLGDAVPLCADAFAHRSATRDPTDRLVLGDEQGRLHFFAVSPAFLRPSPGAPPPRPAAVLPVHAAAVTAVRYVSLSESSKGLVVSASLDGTLALVDTIDLSVRHYRGHLHAVLCFAVCPEPLGYIVSGGHDCDAQVTSPPAGPPWELGVRSERERGTGRQTVVD
jgi:WD40 repeat protein